MKKNAKIILWIIVILLIAGIIFYKANKPIEVATVNIEQKDMIRSFKETSTLVSQNEISITPAYNSEVLFIIQKGKEVNKGELLLSLDTKQLEYTKQNLQAQIQALYGQENMNNPKSKSSDTMDLATQMAKNSLDRAREDETKYRKLYEEGAISKTEYDAFNRIYQDAQKMYDMKKTAKTGSRAFYKSQREALQATLDDIEYKLTKSKIYADKKGVITSTFAKKGDMANPMMPIIHISGTDDLLAVCDIISTDALALKKGQKVEIIEKIGQESSTKMGKIVNIAQNANTKISSLGLEEQRVEVKVKSDSFKNLIVGCDVDIIFETMHLKDKITVPKSATFKKDNQNYVWLVSNGKLIEQKIEIDKDSDYDYEVISGLNKADIVVIDSNNKDLKVGKKVKIIQ